MDRHRTRNCRPTSRLHFAVGGTCGLSRGLIVRSVGLTKGLTGTVRSLKAGEVKEFTEIILTGASVPSVESTRA